MARNKHPEETKNLILETATWLFLEKGYDHTSIQDIIDNLGGLSKGAIYHHFKSKEEIMWAVGDRFYAGTEKSMKDVSAKKELNGRAKLKQMFYLSLFSEEQDRMFQMMPDMMKNSQLLVMYLRNSVQHEAPEMVQKILKEGIEDGSIQVEYPEELSEVLMLVANLWMNPTVYPTEPEDAIRKMKFFQYMMRQLGLDIIGDDMVERMDELLSIYEEHREK